MNRKHKVQIVLIALFLCSGAFFCMRFLFTRLVFNRSVSIDDRSVSIYRASTPLLISNNPEKKESRDVVIHFQYDYPLVKFSGIVIVTDASPNHVWHDSSTGSDVNTLYIGDYSPSIEIVGVPYFSDRNNTMRLSIAFIRGHDIYTFNSTESEYPILDYSELTIRVTSDSLTSENVLIFDTVNSTRR